MAAGIELTVQLGRRQRSKIKISVSKGRFRPDPLNTDQQFPRKVAVGKLVEK